VLTALSAPRARSTAPAARRRRGEIAGAVALVLRDGRPVYERAVGWADREAGRRMTPDAIFRIASQTKALTSVAAMQLAEEGRLALDDPVSRYIPAFARTTVASGPTPAAPSSARGGRSPIRDLLTHTAGISYGTDSLVAPLYAAAGLGPAAGYGWYTADKPEPICATMERLATLPFVAQPGERFVYGYATDVLGCVVERAAGAPLDAVIRARITGPLGMRDTHFFLPPAKRDRLTAVYTRATDGGAAGLVRAPEGARGQGHYVEGPRRASPAARGSCPRRATTRASSRCCSTAARSTGARVLGPKTVALMTTNQTDTLFNARGLGFGLGFEVVERAGAGGRVESVGTFGWGGAYGSSYTVDPRERLVVVLLTQRPAAASTLDGRFAMLVYQALVAARGASRERTRRPQHRVAADADRPAMPRSRRNVGRAPAVRRPWPESPPLAADRFPLHVTDANTDLRRAAPARRHASPARARRQRPRARRVPRGQPGGQAARPRV
jgi:CubicO group peptidase (beta-lactamase class C family)